MATKKICDRCGAEINPMYQVRCVVIRKFNYDIDKPYELCMDCEELLREWLGDKDDTNGEGGTGDGEGSGDNNGGDGDNTGDGDDIFDVEEPNDDDEITGDEKVINKIWLV